MKRFGLTLGAAAIMLGLSTGAQATLLSNLLAGASITAGDKVFDQFRVIFQDNLGTALVDPANIEVSSLNDGGSDPGPGLRFDILNGAMTVVGNGSYAYSNYMFGFRVTSLGGPIKDNSLYLTGSDLSNPTMDLGVTIQELVGTAPTLVEDPGNTSLPDLGVKQVENSYLSGVGATSNLTDLASFAPHTTIYVSKNLYVWASDAGETARLTQFAQRFSQVPLPGTLALLCMGLIGAYSVRRRD
jgi:hypothetical protein